MVEITRPNSNGTKPTHERNGLFFLALLRVFRKLPGGVWALGVVSLFSDISSELIHSLLPLFMATSLGASISAIGIIEGVAEGTAAITKVFSGAISDYLGKRKALAVVGYGVAAAAKPIFPLATTIHWVFVARFIDRIAKGIRGAPRDALVADIAPPELRGAAYGLRQSLDTVGAFIGPLAAFLLMIWLANDIRAVLWIAGLPALLGLVVLVLCVHDPHHVSASAVMRTSGMLTEARRLPLKYWLVVLVGAVFTLARFSEAFLLLRAQNLGLAFSHVPLVLIVMNLAYMVTSYPAGVAADLLNPRTLLLLGLIMLAAADLVLAAAPSPSLVFIGAGLWGVHMGLTQGLFAKLVADAVPANLRGASFGIFNLVGGMALLLASVIAGALWTTFGAPATFIAGALFAIIAMVGTLVYRRQPSVIEKGE